jgi:DNA polymerase-3 subunit gamma/tau
VVSKDVAAGLRIINGLNSDGVDLRQFNMSLVEYLRGLLLAKSRCEEALDVTTEDLAEMGSLVTNATLDYLLRAVKSFSSIDFRSDNYSALSLELALLGCVLSPPKERESPSAIEPSKMAVAIDAVESTQETQGPATLSNPEVPGELPGLSDLGRVGTDAPSKEIPQDIDYLRSRWKDFIKSLRGEGSGGNLDAFLRSACDPVELEDDTLVLGFRYPFHKEKIEDGKYRHLVEKKLKEVFGRPYKIRCILIESKKEVPSRARTQNPVIKAALEMGAKIKEEL